MWLFSPNIPKCFGKRSSGSCDSSIPGPQYFRLMAQYCSFLKGLQETRCCASLFLVLLFPKGSSTSCRRFVYKVTTLQTVLFPPPPRSLPPLHPSPVLIFCSVSTPILALWPPNSMMVSKSRHAKKQVTEESAIWQLHIRQA